MTCFDHLDTAAIPRIALDLPRSPTGVRQSSRLSRPLRPCFSSSLRPRRSYLKTEAQIAARGLWARQSMQGLSPTAAAGQHKLVHRRLATLGQAKQHCIRTRLPQAAAGNSPNPSSRVQQVLDGIDALNSNDPRQTTWRGETLPYELAYSQWLTDWVLKLEPQPSEELRIVARGQHVERWRSPRSNYPEGKTGYFKWREDLKKAHASTVTDLMQQAGYDQDSQDRVTRIILKKDLKKDPENQIVEDGLCLVFLEHQFADLLEKEGTDKMVDIVRKTWLKMGEKGRAAALKLDLPADQAYIVQRALQS